MKKQHIAGQHHRRDLLCIAGKGSAIAIGKNWAAPAIMAIAIPAHATTSPITTRNPGRTTLPPTTLPPTTLPPTTTPLSLVCAEEETDSDFITLTRTDFNQNLVLNQYQPLDGVISEAILSYQVRVQSDFKVENRDSKNQQLTLNSSAVIQLQAPDGQVIASITPSDTRLVNLTSFDGTADFEGNSGFTLPNVIANRSGEIDLIARGVDMSLLVGSGQVTFVANADSLASVISTGNVQSEINTFASVEVSIRYACKLEEV